MFCIYIFKDKRKTILHISFTFIICISKSQYLLNCQTNSLQAKLKFNTRTTLLRSEIVERLMKIEDRYWAFF